MPIEGFSFQVDELGEKYLVIPEALARRALDALKQVEAGEEKVARSPIPPVETTSWRAAEESVSLKSDHLALIKQLGRSGVGVGAKLRELRESKGFGLNETARAAKMTSANLHKVETSKSVARPKTFLSLVSVLEKSTLDR